MADESLLLEEKSGDRDKVQALLAKIWNGMVRLHKPLLLGVGLLVVLGIVLAIAEGSSSKGVESRSADLYLASKHIGIPAGLEQSLDPMRPHIFPIESEEKRNALVAKAVEAYQNAYDGDAVNELVGVTSAQNKYNRGELDAAKAEVDAWLASYPKSLSRPVMLELRARVEAAQGQVEVAAATYRELAAVVEGEFKAATFVRLGDLYNPAIGAGADAGKAKEAYAEALAALGDDDSVPSLLGNAAGLREKIEYLQSLLPE